eukprot:1704235-Prymnesium_polylepis.1
MWSDWQVKLYARTRDGIQCNKQGRQLRPGLAQCRLANLERPAATVRTRQERACGSDLLVAHHA